MRFLESDAEQVRTVAKRWKGQYCTGGRWDGLFICEAEDIYRRLLALPPMATAKDVELIIGNDGWIGESCTECDAKAIVLVGEEQDYESATVFLCAACVEKLAQFVASGRSA